MAAKALFRRINPHYIGHIRGSDRKGFRAIGLGFANDWDDTVSYHIIMIFILNKLTLIDRFSKMGLERFSSIAYPAQTDPNRERGKTRWT